MFIMNMMMMIKNGFLQGFILYILAENSTPIMKKWEYYSKNYLIFNSNQIYG